MERITITGTALDAKSGAVVRSDEGVFYIQGMDEWPDEFLGETVEVTGLHSTVDHEQKSTDAVQVTEMVGKRDIISEATYTLVDE